MEIRQLKYFIAAAKHLNFTKAAAEDMEEFKEGYDHVINAKAVIDATGGYAGNSQMELELLHNEYYPLNGVWKLFSSHQNDGKMMQAAMDIGAGLYNESIPPEIHNSGTEKWITTAFEKNYIEGQVGVETGRPALLRDRSG